MRPLPDAHLQLLFLLTLTLMVLLRLGAPLPGVHGRSRAEGALALTRLQEPRRGGSPVSVPLFRAPLPAGGTHSAGEPGR